MKVLLSIYLIALIGADVLRADIHRIPRDYSSIQEGINAAAMGDTVLIAPGVYYETIDLQGKALVLGSFFLIRNDTSYISTTIIDGANRGSVVTFSGGENHTTHLIGVTVRGGSGTLRNYSGVKPFHYGGGIFCENTSPTLAHLIITSNHTGGGGGIFLKNSHALLHDIDIRENSALSPIWEAPNVGGGMLVWDSSPLLQEVNVSHNHCEIAGGGLYLLNSSPMFRNLSVTDNRSLQWGGGIFCDSHSRPVLINVTLAGNEAAREGGGLAVFNDAHPILFNSILWYNSTPQVYALPGASLNSLTVAYSNAQGGISALSGNTFLRIEWLEENMDREPMFADMEAGKYYLQSASPCVDTGSEYVIIEGDTLLILPRSSYAGKAPDMGRYESVSFTVEPEATSGKLPAGGIRNYPNPFNPSTTIELILSEAAEVKLAIYNPLGQEVATLVEGHLPPGRHRFVWQAETLPGGVYFYRLRSSRDVQTRKMLLLK